MAAIASEDKDLMGSIMADVRRAQELGLIPDDQSKISKRGEFIISPSNVDQTEDAKMRGYRFKSMPMAMHRWGVTASGELGDVEFDVKDQKEYAAAIEAGAREEKFTEAPDVSAPAMTLDPKTPAQTVRNARTKKAID